MICSRFKPIAALALLLLTLFATPLEVECANKKSSPSAPAAHEPTIEDVTAKQLERILAEKDYVAVYWCKSKFSMNSSSIRINSWNKTVQYQKDKSEISRERAEKYRVKISQPYVM